ncbi:MAG: transcription antitermination factor NusB [FCB group bacterium]|nr:transcription antitermination factor NusB [FCB group bacterium]
MGVRTRSRKALLQGRFACVLNEDDTLSDCMKGIKQSLSDPEAGIGASLDSDNWNWLLALGQTIEANIDEIDESIAAVLENWTLERLSIVTRLILEQAVAEMNYLTPHTPVSVVIDEALELTRVFETEETVKFVNAILDRLKNTETE